MVVKVISGGDVKEYRLEEKVNLLEFLQNKGYKIAARCGGNGKCGKCRVRVTEGSFENMKDGFVLACNATISDNVTVEVFETRGGGLTYSSADKTVTDGEEGYGVALDIGTTTLAFSLVSLKDGKELDKFGVLNNQGAFGADVLSRISACAAGKADLLQASVLSQTRDALAFFKNKFGIANIKRLTVSANTTMLHFFLGKDARGIGKYPFKAEFLNTVRISGNELSLDVEEVVVMPSVHAYFGADAVAGGMITNLDDGVNILADVGTNGEILIYTGKKYIATSTAAGPCFEGANIECGTGGVEGAIDKVEETDGKIKVSVIGGKKATGICGAGLVDAIALMLKKGIIDETGAFTDGNNRFYLTERVYITQADVRSFQLAKSAICAGIKVLADFAGVKLDCVDNLYVAGGLGFYLNKENAFYTGLFPKELSGKTVVAGNTALAGAKQCLCSAEKLKKAEFIAENTEYLDLSASEKFMGEYILNMNFGE